VHLTFQNCDQSGKRHRIREALLWDTDPSAHYAPPGGLISFDLDLPDHLTGGFAPKERVHLKHDDELVARHFRLMNHQLAQLRTAFGVALALNRTLVLPRLLCGLETVTNFPHSGVRCQGSPGCTMRLPYWCPADHVLRMHYLAGVMPQKLQVPLRYAEHSLLQHPKAPASTLRDRVDVTLGAPLPAAACARCGDSGYVGDAPPAPKPPAARRLALAGGEMSEGALRDALEAQQAEGAPLLHFMSMRPSEIQLRFPPAKQRAFEESMKPLGGGWCCVDPPTRGAPMHYWYDALLDLTRTRTLTLTLILCLNLTLPLPWLTLTLT